MRFRTVEDVVMALIGGLTFFGSFIKGVSGSINRNRQTYRVNYEGQGGGRRSRGSDVL